MRAYEVLQQVDFIQRHNFEFVLLNGEFIRTNEFLNEKVTGCCALGAFKLAYSDAPHGLDALKYTMKELRKRGFQNLFEFGDSKSREEVLEFFKEINV